MRTFGRNAIIGVVGVALTAFAALPAHADNGRHDRYDRRAAHSVKHDTHWRDCRRDHRHGYAKRFDHRDRVVYHHRGRTVIAVPARPRRPAVRHHHHHHHRHDPLIRTVIRVLNY